MTWIYILSGVFFILMGLAVHVLKWHFLIAGYNTMPKEKQANVDTEGLGRLLGLYGYVNGMLFIVMGMLNALDIRPGITSGMMFFGFSTVYVLIKAQKYDGNIVDQHGRLRKDAVRQLALPIGITVVALVAVAVLMLFLSQPTRVTVLPEGIKIHGMYGGVYTWESIEEARLLQELPTIVMRTNGSALGSKLKGHFRTKELGAVKLFVDTQLPPFVHLETDRAEVIFNLSNGDETREIFGQIVARKP
ncbi:MAG: DUF3784 domain-containing protein [Bacillota bacterium]|jgi:hypothetical protein